MDLNELEPEFKEFVTGLLQCLNYDMAYEVQEVIDPITVRMSYQMYQDEDTHTVKLQWSKCLRRSIRMVEMTFESEDRTSLASVVVEANVELVDVILYAY